MALPDALRARFDRMLTEQRQRDRIREHGFAPMRKLLRSWIAADGADATATGGDPCGRSSREIVAPRRFANARTGDAPLSQHHREDLA